MMNCGSATFLIGFKHAFCGAISGANVPEYMIHDDSSLYSETDMSKKSSFVDIFKQYVDEIDMNAKQFSKARILNQPTTSRY